MGSWAYVKGVVLVLIVDIRTLWDVKLLDGVEHLGQGWG